MSAPEQELDAEQLRAELERRTRQVDELRTLLREVRDHAQRELGRAARDQAALEEALAAAQQEAKTSKSTIDRQKRDLATARPYLRGRRLVTRVKRRVRRGR